MIRSSHAQQLNRHTVTPPSNTAELLFVLPCKAVKGAVSNHSQLKCWPYWQADSWQIFCCNEIFEPIDIYIAQWHVFYHQIRDSWCSIGKRHKKMHKMSSYSSANFFGFGSSPAPSNSSTKGLQQAIGVKKGWQLIVLVEKGHIAKTSPKQVSPMPSRFWKLGTTKKFVVTLWTLKLFPSRAQPGLWWKNVRWAAFFFECIFHREGSGRLPSSPSRSAKPLRRQLWGNYSPRRLPYIPRSLGVAFAKPWCSVYKG